MPDDPSAQPTRLPSRGLDCECSFLTAASLRREALGTPSPLPDRPCARLCDPSSSEKLTEFAHRPRLAGSSSASVRGCTCCGARMSACTEVTRACAFVWMRAPGLRAGD